MLKIVPAFLGLLLFGSLVTGCSSTETTTTSRTTATSVKIGVARSHWVQAPHQTGTNL